MNLENARLQMEKTLEALSSQITGLSTTITPKLVGAVKFEDHNKQKIQIDDVCIVTCKNKNIIVIPYDQNHTQLIINHLNKHKFNAFLFSKTEIIVNIPSPSTEEQIKIAAAIKKMGDDAKVSLRNIRHNYKNKNKTKDQHQNSKIEKEIDNLIVSYNKKIDVIIDAKISPR